MDFKINVSYLRKEMLQHELVVRGITRDDTKTVDSLRSTLRSLLAMEKRSSSLSYPPYSLNIDEELQQVKTYFEEAKSDIQAITPESGEKRFLSVHFRLIHLFERLNRIPLTVLSDEQAPIRSALLAEILSTMDQLGANIELTDGQGHDVDDVDDVNDDVDDASEVSVHSSRLRPPAHISTFRNHSSSSKNPYHGVEKWNLKFTGDSKTLSVHNFLERVSELSTARNVPESQLFKSAIDLFAGKALNWFRANRGRFNDWPSLSILLRRHFEPPDYRSRLFREILDRTQDTSESIVDYMSSMQGLFRRHGGLSQEAQLDILVRNLSPFYATQLPVVTTLEELELECLKLETKKHRVETYIPPSRRRQQLVEPDFAFVQMENAPSAPSSRQRTSRYTSEEVNAVHPFPHNSAAASVKCFNCQQLGHFSKDCPNPRRMRCYRCGTPNVTVRTCTKCPGNGPRRNQ